MLASTVSRRITARASRSAGAPLQRLFLGLLRASNYLATRLPDVGSRSILFHTHATSGGTRCCGTHTQAETTSKLILGCFVHVSNVLSISTLTPKVSARPSTFHTGRMNSNVAGEKGTFIFYTHFWRHFSGT